MEKFKKLSKAEMKNILGGDDEISHESGNYYMCCSPVSDICGQCSAVGNGQCQGNGIATAC